MDFLKQAIRSYGGRHADCDGIVRTPVPGLMLKCIEVPHGNLHAISHPLLVVVLQGAKRLAVGRDEQMVLAGQSALLRADMPALTRIVHASRREPYLAVAVALKIALLGEISSHLELPTPRPVRPVRDLIVRDIEAEPLDCIARLIGLLKRPDAIPLLEPGITRELHYWLLCGAYGGDLLALAAADSHRNRIGAAVATIRTQFRCSLRIADLAAIAGMSLTSFHRHFKQITSLTPQQYQQRLRLIEARRLMLEEGSSATSAAFDVGYESVSQFTREYGRLFKAPPKRHVMGAGAARRGREHVAIDRRLRSAP